MESCLKAKRVARGVKGNGKKKLNGILKGNRQCMAESFSFFYPLSLQQ